MRISFIAAMLMVLIPIIIAVLFFITCWESKYKKVKIILCIIFFIFGSYNLYWTRQASLTESIKEETITKIYEVDKLTTTEVEYNDVISNIRDHIEDIKENNDEYQNVVVVLERTYEKPRKYLGLIDLMLYGTKRTLTLYTTRDAYIALTHRHVLYEK